jgi:PTH1 family peptidyl-tRNA hydrolase
MKLIVGLGNIGKRFIHTRHNIGFMVVTQLADQLSSNAHDTTNAQIFGRKYTDWKVEPKLQAAVAKIELENHEIILAKPQTMMNASGDAVQRLMQKYRLAPADVWVIYDDVDVNFGRMRIRHGATSGQQGIRSITSAIGSQFVHVRMGISLNDRAVEPSEIYVLKPFNQDEQAKLAQVLSQAAINLRAQIEAPSTTDTTFDLIV